jgi:hypothetical protein
LALAASGDLVTGGDFTMAGGVDSAYVARLTTTCPALAAPFAAGCPSAGGNNVLAASSLPWVDATFHATASGLPSAAVALAVSSVTPVLPAFPLLAVFPEALPGCNLHVAPDILEQIDTTTGTAESSLFLPSTPPLVGVVFYHQMVVIDVTSSAFQITSTNALQLTVGMLW